MGWRLDDQSSVLLDPQLRRSALLNKLLMVLILIAGQYILWFPLFGERLLGEIAAGVTLYFAGCMALNMRRRFKAARVATILGVSLTLLFYSNVLGLAAGIHLVLFSAMALPFALFPKKEKGWIALGITLPAVCFVFLHIHLAPFFTIPPLKDAYIPIIYFTAALATAIILLLSTYFFYQASENAENSLQEKNRVLQKFNEELKIKAELDKEIAAAKLIQESLLPKTAPPYRNYDMDHFFMPANRVSGDYYDYFPLSADRVGILVADIVGKGIPASMMMIMFKGLMQTAAAAKLGPAKTCELLNHRVFSNILLGKYVPIIYGILDTKAHTFTYANAGHEPAWLIRDNDAIELREGGLPLGAYEIELFEEGVIHLAPNDRVVMFTDGVTDAQNPQNEKLAIETTLEILKNRAKNSENACFVGDVGMDILSHMGGAAQTDDMTIVSFRREK